MARRKLGTTVTEDNRNRLVTITVEHDDWQSFSRAVIPRADRELKQWMRGNNVSGGASRVSTSLAHHTVLGDSTRCISIFRYGY